MKTLFPADSPRRLARPQVVAFWLSALCRHGHRLVLPAIVLGAALLALRWVFLVPIYQAPDEPLHLDYALAIREHGLFWVHHTSWDRLPEIVHPYTKYLIRAVRLRQIAFNPQMRVTPGYGTPAFYAAIERDAPRRDNLTIDTPSKPFSVYPFGYYGLTALWLRFLHLFNDGPVFTFFAARILSVLLLSASLFFVNATVRALRFKPWHALLVTAAIGFFPLTSFIASAVQPDNLSFLFVSAAFYLAVQARQTPASPGLIGLLGLVFGLLLVTKQHFFVCALVPTAAMLATRMDGISGRRRLGLAGLLLLPSVLAGSLYLGMTWGLTNYYGPPAPCKTNVISHTLQGLQRAFLDYYSGKTHESFWGVFGWLDAPLVIRGKNTTAAVEFVIQLFSWLILGLTLLRLEQVGSRLVRLGWRGRSRLAVRLACSDPLLNGYFLLTLFMFYIHVRIGNRFGAQGRNWWPFLLPIFLSAISYAPRALTLRWSRRALSATVLAGLLLYGAAGSFFALSTIEKRYYEPLPPHELQAISRGPG